MTRNDEARLTRRDAAKEVAAKPIFLINAQYLPTSRDWRTSGGQDSPFEVDTFIREARSAEDAGFDAFFQADFSGVKREALRSGPPLTAFDSFQMAALIASATKRIAVMPTVSTLHTHPFSFARGLASLDRISRGRAWINIVSSFRTGTGLGARRTIARDRRHEQTEEFVNVAKRLWASWPPAANEPDGQRYIREDLIVDLDHSGEFYEQPGPIDWPPFSEKFPLVLQATSSLEGLRLAARTADAVFAGTQTLEAARELRRILRKETENAGRRAGDVTLLPGCYIRVVEHDTAAEEIERAERRQLERAFGEAGALARIQARFPHLKLNGASLSDPVPRDILPDDPDEVFAAYGSGYLPLWARAREPSLTIAEFVAAAWRSPEHVRFTGTADQIAREITCWLDEGGVDGFQFILGNDFDAICRKVLPALRAARG